MRPQPLRWLAAWLAFALALLCPAARADTPVTLFKSFAGYVNFTGTEATMRTSGTQVCSVASSTTKLSKTLSGIPTGARILYARLYWAGSANTVDTQVTFNNQSVAAEQSYTAAYSTNGYTYNYFAAAADVTSIVAAQGNGTYTFSGLTVSNGSPWCAVEGVLGGFALAVVYEDSASQPFRVLNVYEGFQYTRNSSLTLSLSNFRVPNPIGNATGRIGHVTWEGDDSLSAQGENLSLNGTIMTDAMNPSGNQFNSKSNIDGDPASYGIDFDAYTIGSPVLQPDETTATTVYSSGQDLVLLSAEIVAVPNVPTDDLGLTMTRSGETIPGQNVSYALQVQNNGPNDEIGPITVTDTLPSGMALASYSGTGWSCSVSGQSVTCVSSGTLAAPAYPAVATYAPLLTLNVAVSASATGEYTNTASVAGTIFDNVPGNNSASDTASDPTVTQGAGMILTDAACTANVALTSSSSPCHRITWLTANAATTMYITNVDSSGVPQAVKPKGNTKFSTYVSLNCINPSAASTLQATFAGALLPGCFANGTSPTSWAPVTLNFAAGSPSATLSGAGEIFQYADVGLLQLNFTDLSGTVRSARFISQPASLTIAVTRAVDGVANPGTNVGNTTGFAAAGEAFTVTVGALMGGTTPQPAPSFGKETTPVALALGQTPTTTPAVSGTFRSGNNGTMIGTFVYKEAGDVALKSMLASPLKDYLGSGHAVQDSAYVNVGRFYPAYFETVVTAPFACQIPMNCPSGLLPHGEKLGVSNAVYSGQPFTVKVIPKAVDGTALTNYTGGNFSNTSITLKAVAQPGSSTAAGGGTLGGGTVALAATTADTATGTPVFTLTAPYVNSAPRGTWTAPQAVYINATAPQTRSGVANVTIDSNRAATGISVEGGVMVVNGRLRVSNAYGSELLRIPVPLAAQYWTGSAWLLNADDSSSAAGPGTTPLTNCTISGCALTVTPSSLTLKNGVGTAWLSAPGVRGAVTVTMTGAPAYLPSTSGRVVFGVYKSQLIYFREVY